MPRWRHEELRLIEIQRAIGRYAEFDPPVPVPTEWVEELDQLIASGNKRRRESNKEGKMPDQDKIRELEAWKREIDHARDAAMDAVDRNLYLGQDTADIITDVFARVHEAERKLGLHVL